MNQNDDRYDLDESNMFQTSFNDSSFLARDVKKFVAGDKSNALSGSLRDPAELI